MAPAPDITNIPAPRVPFIDERTGLMAREWYLFFLNLYVNTGGASNLNVKALQLAPAPQDAAALLQSFYDAALEPQNGDPLALLPDFNVAPVVQPEVQKLYYGAFHDMNDQTAAAINTAYAVTFSATDVSYGVRIGSPTSQILIDNPGVYNFQFSLQIDKTVGGAGILWIWADINGTAVAESMSRIRIKDNDDEHVAAWNFVLPVKAGDYFRLMWAVDNVDIFLDTFAATAFGPATPSAILTVTQVNL